MDGCGKEDDFVNLTFYSIAPFTSYPIDIFQHKAQGGTKPSRHIPALFFHDSVSILQYPYQFFNSFNSLWSCQFTLVCSIIFLHIDNTLNNILYIIFFIIYLFFFNIFSTSSFLTLVEPRPLYFKLLNAFHSKLILESGAGRSQSQSNGSLSVLGLGNAKIFSAREKVSRLFASVAGKKYRKFAFL